MQHTDLLERNILNNIKNNLLLKYSAFSFPVRYDFDINLNWNTEQGLYYFKVGRDYLPDTIIVNPSGCLYVESDSKEIKVPGNSAVILNSGKSYRLSYLPGCKNDLLFAFFSEEFVRELRESGLFRGLFFEKSHFCDTIFIKSVKTILNNFNCYLEHDVDEGEVFYNLFSYLCSCQSATESEIEKISSRRRSTREFVYSKLNTAFEFLSDNCSRNLTLDEVANESALSKYYLIKVFKEVYSVTPMGMHLRLRMKKAKELLMEPANNISDICFKIGYCSLGTFSNVFKEFTGLSPSAFRKQNINRY